MAVYQIFSSRKISIFQKISPTSWLIIFNVLFYIIFSVGISSGLVPLDFIALKPSNILQGLYLWTFLTSMFMHAGLFHLFVNMISLFFVGTILEKILGKKRYITFYLLAGLFSGLIFVLSSMIFPSDFTAYAVGASGAIFGLIGVLMLLTPNLPVYIMFIPIPVKMKYAAPFMLFLLWLISIAGDISIGNTAHLGGFIVGLIYGLYLKRRFPSKIQFISSRFS